jgi:hypothetical protein
MTSFPSELAAYVGNVRSFSRVDWSVYVGWVGLMLGLVVSTGGFLLLGHLHGVAFPAEAYWVPGGAAIFAGAVSVDTIGHRAIYRSVIEKAEGLVHGITIFFGITSCMLLCAAYEHRAFFWIPALATTAFSFVYSLVDEALHWKRYSAGASDRVEMWSHAFIFLGHTTMMVAWWSWFSGGYVGVAETLAAFHGAF